MRFLSAFVACGLVAGGVSLPAQTAANVLLVINTNSEISRKIGEYYAGRREIPGKNICRIAVTDSEEISRQVYDHDVESAIAECLRSQDLTEQVLYLVTTKGVPLKIAGAGGLKGDAAAVDSELTLLYQKQHGKTPSIHGPERNPFFGRSAEKFEHPKFPIYLVTRLAGYNLEDVRGIIDRSLRARNRGFVVIDLPSNSGNDQGNRWLREAVQALPAKRVRVEETPAVLYGVEDVIGYASWGSNDDHRTRDGRRFLGFRWLPGAIATEYVSTNARTFEEPPASWTLGVWNDPKSYFAGSPQGLTADYVREGVTGVSGHVYEPFLPFTPRPQYLFPAYFAGRNLAESFYLAIPALSWMNIVVGDPLCRIGPPESN